MCLQELCVFAFIESFTSYGGREEFLAFLFKRLLVYTPCIYIMHTYIPCVDSAFRWKEVLCLAVCMTWEHGV